MDFQTMIDNAMKARRQDELKGSNQLMLGEIILKIEALPNKDLPIMFDHNDLFPTTVGSWRGAYCEMYISFDESDKESYNTDYVEWKSEDGQYVSYKQKELVTMNNPTTQQFLDMLKESKDKVFVGWKGGDFLMSKNTPVWVSQRGTSAGFRRGGEDDDNYNTFVIDVIEVGGKNVLITKDSKY